MSRDDRDVYDVPVAIVGMGPRDSTDEAWQVSRARLERAIATPAWLAPDTSGPPSWRRPASSAPSPRPTRCRCPHSGWSGTLVAGPRLLAHDVEENERLSSHGLSDLVRNRAAAPGGAVVGVVVATSTCGVLAVAALVPALVPLLAIPVAVAPLARSTHPGVGSP